MFYSTGPSWESFLGTNGLAYSPSSSVTELKKIYNGKYGKVFAIKYGN